MKGIYMTVIEKLYDEYLCFDLTTKWFCVFNIVFFLIFKSKILLKIHFKLISPNRKNEFVITRTRVCNKVLFLFVFMYSYIHFNKIFFCWDFSDFDSEKKC